MIARPSLALRIILQVAAVGLSISPARALLCGTTLNPVAVSTTGLAFGTYDPLANADTFANATITVTCSSVLLSTLPSFTIALSAGGAGRFNSRALTLAGGTATFNYNIFTGASLGTVWGDGTGSTVTQSYNANLLIPTATFTAYGDIPKRQSAGIGSYGDAITITISY